jgi:hypothetical protein
VWLIRIQWAVVGSKSLGIYACRRVLGPHTSRVKRSVFVLNYMSHTELVVEILYLAMFANIVPNRSTECTCLL